MRKLDPSLLIISIVAIVSLCAMLFLYLEPARNLLGDGSLSLQPPIAPVPGERIRVDVTVTNVSQLAGVQLDVRYDPAVLSYAGIAEGSFLSSGGAQTYLPSTVKASTGYLDDIIILRIGGDASGNGVLVSLFFDAVGGSTELTLENVLLSDSTAMPITASLIGTRVTIVSQDADGDGVIDSKDQCPGTAAGVKVDAAGCPIITDSDGDGVIDSLDLCPGTPAGTVVSANGCAIPADTDKDGVPDSIDVCPGTLLGVQVTANGCPVDTDSDKVPDYLDQCPGTASGIAVDAKGCPIDSDGDGVADAKDRCPGTPLGTRVDKYGCTRRRG